MDGREIKSLIILIAICLGLIVGKSLVTALLAMDMDTKVTVAREEIKDTKDRGIPSAKDVEQARNESDVKYSTEQNTNENTNKQVDGSSREANNSKSNKSTNSNINNNSKSNKSTNPNMKYTSSGKPYIIKGNYLYFDYVKVYIPYGMKVYYDKDNSIALLNMNTGQIMEVDVIDNTYGTSDDALRLFEGSLANFNQDIKIDKATKQEVKKGNNIFWQYKADLSGQVAYVVLTASDDKLVCVIVAATSNDLSWRTKVFNSIEFL